MRLCSLWLPAERRAVLCVVDGEQLLPVGGETARFGDVAELVAAGRRGARLEALVESAGVGSPLPLDWREVGEVEPSAEHAHLLAPVRPQEVWAAGVTYERSRDARMEESADADVYERVYRSERPELFLKASGPRVVGSRAAIGVRGDSRWQVPEPELAIVIGAGGAILGYTLGNDVSSRDIEGENPLYVPQAKIFAGSCALGPVVVTCDELADDPPALDLAVEIQRNGGTIFADATSTSRLHVKLATLVRYLAAENWLPPVTVLLTGTGIVPPDAISLQAGDLVVIRSSAIGTLQNTCAPAATLPPPPGWWT